MARCKVWNDNVHTHTETFKGEKISIPAGGFIEMDWEDAVDFRGQFTGIAPIGPDGKPDARFFKMIRVDKPDEPIFQDEKLVNHANGRSYDSREDLLAALEEFADRRIKDPDLDKELGKQSASNKSEIDELRAQVAHLTSLVSGPKKGPGRPKKEA